MFLHLSVSHSVRFLYMTIVKINLNPAVEERPETPVLEITAVQSIPLDVYETPNGAAAAVSEDRDEKVCNVCGDRC